MSTCKLRVSNAPGPDYALLGLAAVSKNSVVKTTLKAGNREIGYIKGNGLKIQTQTVFSSRVPFSKPKPTKIYPNVLATSRHNGQKRLEVVITKSLKMTSII